MTLVVKYLVRLSLMVLCYQPLIVLGATEKVSQDYLKVMQEWGRLTHFAEQSTQLVINKLKLDLKNNPKYKNVHLTDSLIADLQQFFYETFIGKETLIDLANLYDEYFTLDEMAEIIRFYKTPVGQKLISKNETLTIKTQEIGMQLLKRHQRAYMEILQKHLN